ncbi:hypothetical protein [Luteitalea sp.]
MPPKLCIVRFTDPANTVHTAHVQADTLYEAVVLGVQAFRANPWVPPIGNASKLSVEVREPAVTHEVKVADVVQWTQAVPSSPADKLKRARLAKALLGS